MGRTRHRNRAFLGLACSAIAGACATVPPTADAAGVVELALTASRAELSERVAAGDPEAQYALAIRLDHGLRGEALDPHGAIALRAEALAARRRTAVTQYTAGIDGQPSRVNLIPVDVPVFGINRARAVDACVDSLHRGSPRAACGGEAQAATLRRMWDSAVVGGHDRH